MRVRAMLTALVLPTFIIGVDAPSQTPPPDITTASDSLTRVRLTMDQPRPMAEVLAASFSGDGKIQLVTRGLLVKVADAVEPISLLGDPVGAYVSSARGGGVPVQVSAFGETQTLPIPADFSGLHSIPLIRQTEVQRVASSTDSRVVAVIVHGLSPSPYFLVLADGVQYTRLAEFPLSADPPSMVRVSGDGGTVAVGYVDGLVRLWNVGAKSELPSIHTLPAASSSMIGASFLKALCLSQDGSHVFLARADARGEIADRDGHTQPIVTQLPAQAGTCAFDPGGKFIAVGAGQSELLQGMDGKVLWNKNDAAAPSSYVTFREDSKELLFVDANGVHVRQVESGDVALSFTAYKSSSQSDWTAWSPAGRFDGSQEGVRHLRYTGAESPSPLAIDALVRDYYTPGLVGNILRGNVSVSAPVGSGIPASSSQTVRLRQEGTSAQSVSVALDIMAIDKKGHASVRLFRNGLLVRRWQSVNLANPTGAVSLATTVALLPGTNHLLAYSYDENGIKSSDAAIDCQGPLTVEPGTLHILSIGINHYQNNRNTHLNWAEADAQLIEQVLSAQRTQINREETEMSSHPEMKYSPADRAKFARASGPMDVTFLPSDQASRKNILSKVTEIAAKAKPQDTVILFFAGHGTNRNGTFYFLTSDIGAFDVQYGLDTVPVALLSQGSISDRDLETALDPVDAGSIAVIVDACESGQLLLASTDVRRGPVDAQGFAQLAFEKGISLLAAAPSANEALEGSKIGHGWLTYELGFEGLQNGKARVSDIDADIYLDALFRYAAQEVPKNIVQQPTVYLPASQEVQRTLLGFGAVSPDSGPGGPLLGNNPPPNPTTSGLNQPSLGELTLQNKEQHPALITSVSVVKNQLIATLAVASRVDQTQWGNGDPARKTITLNSTGLYPNSQPDLVAQESNGQYLGVDPVTLTTYSLPEAWKSEASVLIRKAAAIGVVQSQLNSSDVSLQVWDISKNQLLWKKANDSLGSSAISVDGKLLALNLRREVLLAESENGNSRWPSIAFPFQAPFDGFLATALSKDGSLLATSAFGGDTALTIWNLPAKPSDRVIWTAQPHDTAAQLIFFSSATGESNRNFLAAALADGTVSVYQWQTQTPPQQFQSGGRAISILSLSPDGTILVTGTTDGVVSLFDLKQNTLLLRLRWVESAGGWIAQDNAGHFDAPQSLWSQLNWTSNSKSSPVQSSQYVQSLATKVLRSVLSRQ